MKALAINGSPRKGGNTEILLRKVLEPLAAAGHKTEYVQVGGTRIRGCTACGACGRLKNKRCVIEDDIFNLAFAKMLEADAIVIGSPVYFADVTAETKALIDRAGRVARTNGGLLRRKIGAAAVAARRGGAIHAVDAINHLFLANQMVVPGSTYWNFALGRDPGDVLADEEGLANMKDLGEQIAWLLGLLEKRG
ncbi:MAG TPA: flavodoxin family protein [Kiritimatiellia bacterium]|nr:flavodoxin family protein [Kiritimatiellia bacterium]